MAETAWRSRIVGHGEEAPDELLANPRNYRLHPRAQRDALEGVLNEVGWVQNIIINKRTGHVVDGHARVEIAIRRGEPRVPVVYVDLDENEEGVILASLDPLAGMACIDQDKLDQLLAEVSVNDAALRAMLGRAEITSGESRPDRSGRRAARTGGADDPHGRPVAAERPPAAVPSARARRERAYALAARRV